MTKLELEQLIAKRWDAMECAIAADPHGEDAARARTDYNSVYRLWASIPHHEPGGYVVSGTV